MQKRRMVRVKLVATFLDRFETRLVCSYCADRVPLAHLFRVRTQTEAGPVESNPVCSACCLVETLREIISREMHKKKG